MSQRTSIIGISTREAAQHLLYSIWEVGCCCYRQISWTEQGGCAMNKARPVSPYANRSQHINKVAAAAEH
jgi:hypothetical protein